MFLHKNGMKLLYQHLTDCLSYFSNTFTSQTYIEKKLNIAVRCLYFKLPKSAYFECNYANNIGRPLLNHEKHYKRHSIGFFFNFFQHKEILFKVVTSTIFFSKLINTICIELVEELYTMHCSCVC